MDKDTQKKLLETVKKNYNTIAESFSETRQKPIWPELQKITQMVNEGDKVLDVGCGNGRLLQALGDKQIDYLGIDLSEELLKKARENYPGFSFATGDILNLGKIECCDYDFVFSIAVLHHIPGEDLRIQALKQLKNKVKADGKIVVTVWNLWTQKKKRRAVFKYFLLKLLGKNKMDFGDALFDWKGGKEKSVNLQRYYHAFRKKELKRLVKKAGLKKQKIYKDKYNYYLVLRK